MTGRLKPVAQVVTLACVAGLLALLVWKLAHQQHAPAVGAQAPGFTLPRLEGSSFHPPVSLASFEGRPVVLNFWASWCIPCKGEAPVLEREYRRWTSQNVAFLGIDYDDEPSDARTFVAAHKLTFPMLQDGSGSVTHSYGISQVPETYVIDTNGKVVAHLAGPITDPGFQAQLNAAIAKARNAILIPT